MDALQKQLQSMGVGQNNGFPQHIVVPVNQQQEKFVAGSSYTAQSDSAQSQHNRVPSLHHFPHQASNNTESHAVKEQAAREQEGSLSHDDTQKRRDESNNCSPARPQGAKRKIASVDGSGCLMLDRQLIKKFRIRSIIGDSSEEGANLTQVSREVSVYRLIKNIELIEYANILDESECNQLLEIAENSKWNAVRFVLPSTNVHRSVQVFGSCIASIACSSIALLLQLLILSITLILPPCQPVDGRSQNDSIHQGPQTLSLHSMRHHLLRLIENRFSQFLGVPLDALEPLSIERYGPGQGLRESANTDDPSKQ